MEALDDAAAAALFMLALERNPRREHIGLLYEQDGTLRRTPTQTQGNNSKSSGRFEIPQGSARGIFHNHPDPKEYGAERFSPDDIETAKGTGLPSYISAGHRVRRYDPSTGKTEDVLGQIPIDEFRSHLMQKLLGRAPDDPRGLRR